MSLCESYLFGFLESTSIYFLLITDDSFSAWEEKKTKENRGRATVHALQSSVFHWQRMSAYMELYAAVTIDISSHLLWPVFQFWIVCNIRCGKMPLPVILNEILCRALWKSELRAISKTHFQLLQFGNQICSVIIGSFRSQRKKVCFCVKILNTF